MLYICLLQFSVPLLNRIETFKKKKRKPKNKESCCNPDCYPTFWRNYFTWMNRGEFGHTWACSWACPTSALPATFANSCVSFTKSPPCIRPPGPGQSPPLPLRTVSWSWNSWALPRSQRETGFSSITSQGLTRTSAENKARMPWLSAVKLHFLVPQSSNVNSAKTLCHHDVLS